jgi:hypothetical protein
LAFLLCSRYIMANLWPGLLWHLKFV